jgi:hypothetical protein
MSGTHYVSRAEFEANKYLKRIQNGIVKRLYENEKPKFLNKKLPAINTTNGFTKSKLSYDCVKTDDM